MSNSVPPNRRQPTRLPRTWDSPGKNTGVGCYFLLCTYKNCHFAISSFTDIERVLNITRIDCNKNKALFVHCKIPCSATDINWNRTFSERWETIFSLPPTTCVFFCFFFACSWCNYDMWKCNIAKMVLAG